MLRFFDPFFRIAIAIKDDTLMLMNRLFDQCIQISFEIRALFLLIGKLTQCIGAYRI